MNKNIHLIRSYKNWSYTQLVYRILWGFCSILFRLSPKPFWYFRVFILRIFGAKIGKNVRIDSSVKIFMPINLEISDNVGIGYNVDIYNLGFVYIGVNSTISQYTYLCAGTHDYKSPLFKLVKSNIKIGSNVWVASKCFIGPSVSIGDDSIIGACTNVFSDVECSKIVFSKIDYTVIGK